MKVLLVSPLGFAINSETKYAGIERLVWNFAHRLATDGHSVTVMCHAKSEFAEGIRTWPMEPRPTDPTMGELEHFQTFHGDIRRETFDVIHDFSHQHLISRQMPGMPSLNLFWHAPGLAQYPKAPYNIVAPSEWARREFRRCYRQEARTQNCICIDTNLYQPAGAVRSNRFLVVGRMGPEKGNLRAMQLCKTLGIRLDVITARGTEVAPGTPYTDYEQACIDIADGEQIKLYWENDYDELTKISMMQDHMALIYFTDHPEVTNHKVQECLLCGLPVIVPAIGALPEIVTHGVDGYLCRNEQEFAMAINSADKLDPSKTHKSLVQRYAVENVVSAYLPLYEEVRDGARWK